MSKIDSQIQEIISCINIELNKNENIKKLIDILSFLSPLQEHYNILSTRCYTEIYKILIEDTNKPSRVFLNNVYKSIYCGNDILAITTFIKRLLELAMFRIETPLTCAIIYLIIEGIKDHPSERKIKNLLFGDEDYQPQRSLKSNESLSDPNLEESKFILEKKLGENYAPIWTFINLKNHFDHSVVENVSTLIDNDESQKIVFKDTNLEQILTQILQDNIVSGQNNSNYEIFTELNWEPNFQKTDGLSWKSNFTNFELRINELTNYKYDELLFSDVLSNYDDDLDDSMAKYDFWKSCKNPPKDVHLINEAQETEFTIWKNLCGDDEFLSKFILNPIDSNSSKSTQYYSTYNSNKKCNKSSEKKKGISHVINKRYDDKKSKHQYLEKLSGNKIDSTKNGTFIKDGYSNSFTFVSKRKIIKRNEKNSNKKNKNISIDKIDGEKDQMVENFDKNKMVSAEKSNSKNLSLPKSLKAKKSSKTLDGKDSKSVTVSNNNDKSLEAISLEVSTKNISEMDEKVNSDQNKSNVMNSKLQVEHTSITSSTPAIVGAPTFFQETSLQSIETPDSLEMKMDEEAHKNIDKRIKKKNKKTRSN